MHIRQANPSDFDAVTNLLSESGISQDELTPADMHRFLVCQRGEEGWFDRLAVLRTVALLPKHRLPDQSSSICGVIGLKMQDRKGLIHSLALSPDLQEEGDQARLLSELERRAKERGIEQLYVLADMQTDFFQTEGYQIVSHWEIPERLRTVDGEGPIRAPKTVPLRKRIGVSDRELAPAAIGE